MSDPLNLAGVIGTWVAVGLALLALVGILGPLLVLRQIRSERYQALDAVDVQGTGFITRGFRLTRKTRLFRRARVPLLINPPGPETEFHSPAPGTISALSSLTGWVNFASVV